MMNIKPLVLDTTYILPLFGIKIIELSNYKKISEKLLKNGIEGYKLYLPSICLLEVMFKLNGEYRKSKDVNILNRYSVALPSILTSKSIEILYPLLDPEVNRISIHIRHAGHIDLMDCLIAASATSLKGILLSEDVELSKTLKVIPETKDVPIWSWDDLISYEFFT